MNKINAGLGIVLGMLLLNDAFAQQHIGNEVWVCDGAAQAGPCSQIDDGYSNASSGDGYSDNDYLRAAPKVRWADRWGAIAADAQNAKLGVAVSVPSKKIAERAALQDCTKKGGANCKLEIAYQNQCAAMVVGNKVMNTGSAPTLEEAKRRGLSECRKDDTNCRVYYSACSLQERIQ